VEFKYIQVVWLTLVGGLAAYAVVAYLLLTLGDVGMGAVPLDVMPYIAAGAIAMMLGGLGLKRRLLSAIPNSVQAEKRLEQYFAATTVGLALVEGAGLILITLSIVADAPTWTLVGGGAAIGTLIIGRPRREEAGLRPGR